MINQVSRGAFKNYHFLGPVPKHYDSIDDIKWLGVYKIENLPGILMNTED